MPKRRVDEPPLSLGIRDAPTIPDPSVLGLPVPFEMSDVPGFEIDSLPVMWTQDSDARVRPPSGLCDEEQSKHYANDPNPTIFHNLFSRK